MNDSQPAPGITPMQEDEAVSRMAFLVAGGISSEALSRALAAELECLPPAPAAAPVAIDADGSAVAVARIRETFAELLELTVSAEQERAKLQQLTRDQRALQSVATLVARGTTAEGLFSIVTRAAGEALDADIAVLGRFEPNDGVEYVSSWTRSGETVHPRGRLDLTGDGVAARVMVEGRLWGALRVFAAGEDPLAADATERLSAFAELLGLAITTVSDQEELARLAEEQAALRRVATLIARGADPRRVFSAVTEEVGQILGADLAALGRIDEDHRMLSAVATWSKSGDPAALGRWPLTGDNVITAAAATGGPARRADSSTGTGPLAELERSQGAGESVAVPIVVQGSVWGVMVVSASVTRALPAGAEIRLSDFTELVATAIANAESRDELAASRARIVAAADHARARIERDLQDGVQQRLASLGLSLRMAARSVPPELRDLGETLERVTLGFAEAYSDLQEIARGIHPAILAEGGLRSAVAALGRRSPIPVRVEIPELPRLADQVEVAAYYVASEALTNAIKHARPSTVHVAAGLEDGILRLSVSDDGIGGADPAAGSGLIGLRDRIETLSGTMTVKSLPGAGTSISIALPVASGDSSLEP
jgi:signal transduction histidine kinase